MACPSCSLHPYRSSDGLPMAGAEDYEREINRLKDELAVIKKAKKPVKKPINWKRMGIIAAWIVGVATALGLSSVACNACIVADKRDQAVEDLRQDKLGLITVQYAADGSVQRCWRVPRNRIQPVITGSSSSFQVVDLDNPWPDIVENLGIKNIAMCPRYH